MPCGAELHRARCLLCVREGDLPMPAQWYGPGWSIVGVHSVQIIRDRDSWLVAVFLPQRWVNPRWSVLRFRTKAAAIDAAHFRAGQLRPGKRIVPQRNESDSWKCGDLLIGCAPHG